MDVKNLLNSLFLIFLAILANFTFNLLSCPLQTLLENNLLARHILYLSVILFTSTFLIDKKFNPTDHLIGGFILYLFIIILTKMTIPFTIIVFFLLLTLYIIHLYVDYFSYKINNSKDKNEIKIYQNYNNYITIITKLLIILIICITLFGFTQFLLYKKKQYGKQFKIDKFIFGTRICKQ